MCLGVPGRVVSITDVDGVRMGQVDFDGLRKEVCLAYLPDLAVGDYAIVHVGFAITRLDEASARATLEAFRELGVLDEEFGEHPDGTAPAPCPLPSAWSAPPA